MTITLAKSPEQKEKLLSYLGGKIGIEPLNLVGQMPFSVATAYKNKIPVGAILYTNYRKTSIEMTWAGEPGWVTRSTLFDAFAYPFVVWGCLRAWGFVKKSNKLSREFAERLGCKLVGVARHEYGPGQDAVIYAVTRDECRWLSKSGKAVESLSERERALLTSGVAGHG